MHLILTIQLKAQFERNNTLKVDFYFAFAMSFFDLRAFDADEVIDGLFLGSMDASNKLEELKSRKTKRILVAAADLEIHYPKEFDYLRIIVEDSFNQNLLSVLPICMDFIDEIMNEEKRKKNTNDPASILVHW